MPVTARWIEPAQRKGPLELYAREAEVRTLDLLEQSLSDAARRRPGEVIERRLLSTAARDIAELLPRLAPRAKEWSAAARDKLAERGEREAHDLRTTLQQQRQRVRDELAKFERDGGMQQLALWKDDERRQKEADARSWHGRLEQFDRELETEPDRIRAFYEVKAERIEPVGLVYLWPESN